MGVEEAFDGFVDKVEVKDELGVEVMVDVAPDEFFDEVDRFGRGVGDGADLEQFGERSFLCKHRSGFGFRLGLHAVVNYGPVPDISPCIEPSDSPLMACSLTIIWLGGISSSFLQISFGVAASQRGQVEFWKAGQEVCGGGGGGIGIG